MKTVKPIVKQLVVKAPVERAFRVFTEGIDRWWPREHHIGASPMRELRLEPKVGGRWYATCQDGTECDTGRVLVWEPPTRVVLSWQITAQWKFDPEFMTEIEVRFTKEGPTQTRVDFEHRKLEAYGDAALDMAARLDNPQGWNGNLAKYVDAASMKAVVSYSMAPDSMPKALEHFPAHKARLDVFSARGDLLAVGPWADPREGALAIFRTRSAAEEFVKEDPFVLHGVVAQHTIREWNETILP